MQLSGQPACRLLNCLGGALDSGAAAHNSRYPSRRISISIIPGHSIHSIERAHKPVWSMEKFFFFSTLSACCPFLS